MFESFCVAMYNFFPLLVSIEWRPRTSLHNVGRLPIQRITKNLCYYPSMYFHCNDKVFPPKLALFLRCFVVNILIFYSLSEI